MEKGFVYVIESPSAVDLLDGITEGRSLCEALRLSGIDHWYSLATNRETFSQSLHDRLGEALKRFPQKYPLLHLSMHGNDSGVSLTNNEFLSWKELRDVLKPLTKIMDSSSIICLSYCFGLHGATMAMNEENDPTFWALISSSSSISWAEAAVAYITFYHLFLTKGHSLKECVKAMQVASGNKGFMYLGGKEVKKHLG